MEPITYTNHFASGVQCRNIIISSSKMADEMHLKFIGPGAEIYPGGGNAIHTDVHRGNTKHSGSSISFRINALLIPTCRILHCQHVGINAKGSVYTCHCQHRSRTSKQDHRADNRNSERSIHHPSPRKLPRSEVPRDSIVETDQQTRNCQSSRKSV